MNTESHEEVKITENTQAPSINSFLDSSLSDSESSYELSCISDEEIVDDQFKDSKNSEEKSYETCVNDGQRNGLKGGCTLLLHIPLKLVYIVFAYPIKGIINMVDSDVTVILEFCLKLLGISPQRINTKLIKQLIIVSLLIFVFVQSKNDELDRGFIPKRLFPDYSLISDYFTGDISRMQKEIADSELSLVMYYAPWDRQCQELVPHFINTALYHHEQVSFAAVNCWAPNSECQTNFKFLFYPLIVLHVKSSPGREGLAVAYSGPLSSHHLIRFVSDALKPYTYFSSLQQIKEAVSLHQGVFLGYFSGASSGKRDFMAFYASAMSHLQNGPGPVSSARFGLVSDPKLARALSLYSEGSLQLRTHGKINAYPSKSTINVQNITRFIERKLDTTMSWLKVTRKKNTILNRIFQRGPLLLTFIPDNPYTPLNDWYQLVKSITREYYSCHQTGQEALRKSSESNNFFINEWERLKSKISSHNISFFSKSNYSMVPPFVKSGVRGRFNSEASWLEWARERCAIHTDKRRDALNVYYIKEDLRSKNCESKFTSCIHERNSPVCQWNDYESSRDGVGSGLGDEREISRSCFDGPVDFRSRACNRSCTCATTFTPPIKARRGRHDAVDDRMQRLMFASDEDLCKRLRSGSAFVHLPPVETPGERSPDIKGLGCSNTTLMFMAVDAVMHKDLADHYGLKYFKTGAMIMDGRNENAFYMKGPLSRKNLAEFVHDFHAGRLDRGIKVSKIINKVTTDPEVFGIQEMNTVSYLNFLRETDQNLLALHYRSNCGACSGVSNAFMKFARLLNASTSVAVARIDVSRNTVPWHLSFPSLPVIIFHPGRKRSESRVFNPVFPVTVKNLAAFVLSELSSSERRDLAGRMCGRGCGSDVRKEAALQRYKIEARLSGLKSKLKRYEAQRDALINSKGAESNGVDLMKYHILSVLISCNARKIEETRFRLSHLASLYRYSTRVP